MLKKIWVCALFAAALAAPHTLAADSGDPFSVSAEAKIIKPQAKEFPQWAKDLRRFDIIAFGVFPFAWFAASTIVDLYRASTHGWDSRYYPWPAAPANAVPWENEHFIQGLWIAGAISLAVALTDFIIVSIKRNRAAARARLLSPDEPEIRRTPAEPPPQAEEAALPAEAPPDESSALSIENGDPSLVS